MKPVKFNEAKRLAESIDMVKPPRPILQNEMRTYESAMVSPRAISDLLTIMEATDVDLMKIRYMLAAELCSKARELMVYRIINRHETLFKEMRIKEIVDSLPVYAVFLEKHTKVGTTAPQMNGVEVLSNALWPK